MGVFEILAIWGSVTGTVGAVTAVVSVLRDRPKLSVGMGFDTEIGKKPVAWIEVTNAGPRPTTVREVGLFAKRSQVKHTSAATGEETMYEDSEIVFNFPGPPVVLDPHDFKRFYDRPDTISFVHVDFPLRPFALDVKKRRVWGNAGPVARWLIGQHNPPLKEDDDPAIRAAFARVDGRLLPEKVEPRWKLWKPKDLRKPDAWDPGRIWSPTNLPTSHG